MLTPHDLVGKTYGVDREDIRLNSNISSQVRYRCEGISRTHEAVPIQATPSHLPEFSKNVVSNRERGKQDKDSLYLFIDGCIDPNKEKNQNNEVKHIPGVTKVILQSTYNSKLFMLWVTKLHIQNLCPDIYYDHDLFQSRGRRRKNERERGGKAYLSLHTPE